MKYLNSSLKTLFFLLILGFPFSGAVGQTCATPGQSETQAGIDANEVGCDTPQFPVTCNDWENDGNAILTTYRVVETDAIVTKIGVFVGSGSADFKVCLYDNVNSQTEPGSLLSAANPNQFNNPTPGGGGLASYEVSLEIPVTVSAGDTLWPGVKFGSTSTYNLIYQPDAEGVSCITGNPYAANFPNTINSGALGTLPGTYGIYLILEDCSVPGCTDNTACNYDPSATDDDGSCVTQGLGDLDGDGECDCMEPGAINYSPSHTENEFCDWSGVSPQVRLDGDFNSLINSADLLLVLMHYNEVYPWISRWDTTEDGLVSSQDLLDFLQEF